MWHDEWSNRWVGNPKSAPRREGSQFLQHSYNRTQTVPPRTTRLHPIHKDSLDRTGPKSQKIEILKYPWSSHSNRFDLDPANKFFVWLLITTGRWICGSTLGLLPIQGQGWETWVQKPENFTPLSPRENHETYIWLVSDDDLSSDGHRLIRQAGPEWPLLGYTPYESFSNFSLHLTNFFLDFHKNIF